MADVAVPTFAASILTLFVAFFAGFALSRPTRRAIPLTCRVESAMMRRRAAIEDFRKRHAR